jgi:hypothetical protein
VNAIGLNADAHFRVQSDDEWHAVGDRFLPKDYWEPMFPGDEWRRRETGEAVGLRSLTVEAHRSDSAGYVRMEVAPSVRITPHGVYTGINGHFQLSRDGEKGNGYTAARTVEEHWDGTRELHRMLIARLAEDK